MSTSLFTPNNLKVDAIAQLHAIITDNPGANYAPVKAHLDGNTSLRRIVIKRYGAVADRTKWNDQYYDSIYALIDMVNGGTISEDDLD